MPKKRGMVGRKPKQYKKRQTLGRGVQARRHLPTDLLLESLGEEVHIMLPELAARLAAVEHLLVEKQLCSHEDLVRSREFVDIRRGQGEDQ